MKKILFPLALSALLVGCSTLQTEPAGTPKNARDDRLDSRGTLTGEGGLTLFGGGKDGESSGSGGSPIGVNGFLWRATLDTLSFMPLVSADPFGGVIITDWYADPKTPSERFKMTALILDRTLRADGIKVSVFKQTNADGEWVDASINPSTARKLENTILTRARELKVKQSIQ